MCIIYIYISVYVYLFYIHNVYMYIQIDLYLYMCQYIYIYVPYSLFIHAVFRSPLARPPRANCDATGPKGTGKRRDAGSEPAVQG